MENNIELWVVGRVNSRENYSHWKLIGVFSNEEKSIEVCKSNLYFVGPVDLDQAFPDESMRWSGAYYPSTIV